jgi:hypothetical protein
MYKIPKRTAEERIVQGSKHRLPVVDVQYRYNKRFNDMKAEGQKWHPTLKELSIFCNPTRGSFDNNMPNNGSKIDHRKQIDGHARRAVRTLASGMTSGLTSPSRPWFALSVEDQLAAELPAVKLWLTDSRDRMLDVFARSNTYGALHTVYEEIGTFATACMLVEEDIQDVIRCRSYTAGEYYLSIGKDGRVNGFCREFSMTVDQLVRDYGYENCSMTVQAEYDNDQLDKWIKVRHLIEINDQRQPDRADNKNMQYRSIHWEESHCDEGYLRWSGYEEFPILGPRWDVTTTADIYGKGCGWDALGDTKMLQKEQREKLMSIDLVNRPPMQVDASVNGEPNTLPGGVTRSSMMVPNGGVRAAYQINPDINALREDIAEVKRAISEAFYSDLFLMLHSADLGRMTATEVAERQSEKLQILGPVLERLESELLNPLIERTFNIMLRNGLLAEIPEELQGVSLKIKYISILAQAQKMVGVTAMQQHLGMVGNMAQAKPDVVDIVDWDEAARESADMLAISPKLINTRDKVKTMREERAQAQQQAQQQAMALETMKATKSASGAIKDIGDTNVGENSALSATLAGITGGL